MHRTDETTFVCLVGRKNSPGVHPLGSTRDAHRPRQKPRRACLWHDAASREDETHTCCVGSQTNIHRKGHRGANPHRCPVDGGNHRLLALEDSQRHLPAAVTTNTVVVGTRPITIVERSCATRQVGSRTKRLAFTRDDHCTHRVVGIDDVEHVQQLAHHHASERIHLLRPIQRDSGDRLAHLVTNLGELGHHHVSTSRNRATTRRGSAMRRWPNQSHRWPHQAGAAPPSHPTGIRPAPRGWRFRCPA